MGKKLEKVLDKINNNQEKLFKQTMEELQELWNDNLDTVSFSRQKSHGIRSSQIGALVLYLIKKGVIK